MSRELNECVACSILREAIKPESSSSTVLQELVRLTSWIEAHASEPSGSSQSTELVSDVSDFEL